MEWATAHQFPCAEDALEAINVVDMLLGSPHLQHNLTIQYSLAYLSVWCQSHMEIDG